jgi:FG-GAP repeat protein
LPAGVGCRGQVPVGHRTLEPLELGVDASDNLPIQGVQDSVPDVVDREEDVGESNDFFGWSVAAGDFGGSSQADLAIGVSQEGFGSVANAGAVNVIYGSPTGLSATAKRDQFWTQDSPGIGDAAETDDGFGTALS